MNHLALHFFLFWVFSGYLPRERNEKTYPTSHEKFGKSKKIDSKKGRLGYPIGYVFSFPGGSFFLKGREFGRVSGFFLPQVEQYLFFLGTKVLKQYCKGDVLKR